jgi:hypothetical protein
MGSAFSHLEGSLDRILPQIQSWFAAKENQIQLFADLDTRVEGWFKGELLTLFSELEQQGKIQGFRREANLSSDQRKRIQVDVVVQIDGEPHHCELKAACISRAAGTPRNLHFYFREDHVGFQKDLAKLGLLNVPNRWLIGFIYPAPTMAEWQREILSLSKNHGQWQCLTSPDCNVPLFIALWRADS